MRTERSLSHTAPGKQSTQIILVLRALASSRETFSGSQRQTGQPPSNNACPLPNLNEVVP